MPNPEHALTAIADAIQNRQHTLALRWAIVWDGTNFKCVPSATSIRYEFTFMTLTDRNILTGLDDAQWHQLKGAISNFLIQKGFS